MTSTMWKDWGRPRRTGYNGNFGDSFFSDCWDIVDRPAKIIQEDVTSDVPEEKVKPMFRRSHLRRMNSGDDVYQVMLDVRHFTPTDLAVKLVNDKTVTVEGKHGERKDPEGFISREFTRKYNLPDSVHPSTVECFLSSDGVLIIRGQAGKSISNSKTPSDIMMDTTIPIFTQGYQTEPKPNGSSSSTHQNETHHQERIIPINVEDPGQQGEVGEGHHSGRSSRSTTRDERDRMSPGFGDQDQHVNRHQQSFLTNAFTKSTTTGRTIEKERTVSFGESCEESPSSEKAFGGGPSGSGRNSRMSDDAFETRRSPYQRDEGSHQKTSFDNVFTPPPFSPTPPEPLRDRHVSMTKETRGESMESERTFSRNGTHDRIDTFPKESDIFGNMSIPRWKDLNLITNLTRIPLASKEELYDKHFEKGYKNGKYMESFEERFCSEQYSVSSSSPNNREDGSVNKYLQNQSINDPKERLIKISSPA